MQHFWFPGEWQNVDTMSRISQGLDLFRKMVRVLKYYIVHSSRSSQWLTRYEEGEG